MKVLLAIALVFSACGSSAFAASACESKVLESRGWQSLPADQLQCMSNHQEFLQALGSLCDHDQENFSDRYTTYRKFEVSFKQTAQKMLHAPTPAERGAFSSELRMIERDWNLFGFRNEMAEFLMMARHAEYDCSPRSR